MKTILLFAGAAALALGAPAAAKPDGGKGGGHGKGAHAAKVMKGSAHAKSMKGRSAATVKHARASKALSLRTDRNRNGILDRDEALARKYGGALCPPGLAKKTPACVPPGQANRPFREGQRLSSNYRWYTPYNDIPLVLRDHYDLDDDYRYIYRDNVIYVVDPETRLIRDILNAVL